MKRTRTLVLVAAACLAVLAAAAAEALSNSADAFMSLPFGHPFNRTKLRMERSGATAKAQDGDYLSMEGLFEGRPALFVFSFHGRRTTAGSAGRRSGPCPTPGPRGRSCCAAPGRRTGGPPLR